LQEDKAGSLESLKVRVTCGFSSFFDQIRCTVLAEIPARRAMLRTLHRARLAGGHVTSVTTVSILAVESSGAVQRRGQ
jgi:hypothetical protein